MGSQLSVVEVVSFPSKFELFSVSVEVWNIRGGDRGWAELTVRGS